MLQEGGIRVPLIFRWPDMLPLGETFTSPINAMDLTATIASAGEVHPPPDKPFDGVDLVPMLAGSARLPEDRALFFRRRTIAVRKKENHIRQSAVRQGNWKYLRTYKKTDNELFKATLSNLEDDIAELDDRSVSSPERAQQMSDLLEAWENEVGKTAEPFPDSPHNLNRLQIQK